jgi:hypothetical protein
MRRTRKQGEVTKLIGKLERLVVGKQQELAQQHVIQGDLQLRAEVAQVGFHTRLRPAAAAHLVTRTIPHGHGQHRTSPLSRIAACWPLLSSTCRSWFAKPTR